MTLLLIVGAAVLIGTATASFALGQVRNWNSGSAPLTVKGYGSTGSGYGSWRVSTGTDGTRSRLSSQLKIHNVDDHKVFAKLYTDVNAGYCIQPQYTSCSLKYYYYDDSDTGHTGSASWEYHTTSTGVSNSADYARARVEVKLDVPWRSDPASGQAYPGAENY